MKELPVRKDIRLKRYDYNQDGAYFITICTKDKHELFGKIVGDAVHSVPPPYTALSDSGKIVENILEHERNPQIHLNKYVIMPNHIHMILVVACDEKRDRDRDAVDSVPYDSVPYELGRNINYVKNWLSSFGVEGVSGDGGDCA